MLSFSSLVTPVARSFPTPVPAAFQLLRATTGLVLHASVVQAIASVVPGNPGFALLTGWCMENATYGCARNA
eukprot:1636581-Alexandrium_andersonii.AAC.1